MARMVRDSAAIGKLRHTILRGRAKEKTRHAVIKNNCSDLSKYTSGEARLLVYIRFMQLIWISPVGFPVGFTP
jgi:hypothetical protein